MSKIEFLLLVVGMALSLGSIATFIVMNMVVGLNSDTTLIHHQRIFAAAISKALTVPGICMLLAASTLSARFWGNHPLADRWEVTQLILASLAFVNTMFFMRPMVAEVSRLAAQNVNQGRILERYVRRKHLEDRFGAANLLMVVFILLLAVVRF